MKYSIVKNNEKRNVALWNRIQGRIRFIQRKKADALANAQWSEKELFRLSHLGLLFDYFNTTSNACGDEIKKEPD